MDGPVVATIDRGGQGSGYNQGEGTEPSRGGARVESPDGSSPIDALIGLDTGQDIIVETMKAYLTQAKEW